MVIITANALYCIVFIHFYSASHSMSLSEALPTTAIDAVSEFTRRSATGNCKRRTCPRSLHGDKSRFRTRDPPVERHRLYQCATTPHNRNYRNLSQVKATASLTTTQSTSFRSVMLLSASERTAVDLGRV